MKKIIIISVVALALGMAEPVHAGMTALIVAGQVSRVWAMSTQTYQYVTVPPGKITSGDTFKLRATFDLSRAQLSPTFDADPTVNIYSLPGTRVAFRAGTYATMFTPMFDFNSSIQIWNDRNVSNPTDSQSFDFFNYNFTPPRGYAFETGAGNKSESITSFAFDWTATARTNDLITQIAPLSAFSSKSFSYGLLNSSANIFVGMDGMVMTATLAAAPEPSVWASLLFGFMTIGAAVRRRKRLNVWTAAG